MARFFLPWHHLASIFFLAARTVNLVLAVATTAKTRAAATARTKQRFASYMDIDPINQRHRRYLHSLQRPQEGIAGQTDLRWDGNDVVLLPRRHVQRMVQSSVVTEEEDDDAVDLNPCDSELFAFHVTSLESANLDAYFDLATSGLDYAAFDYKLIIDNEEDGQFFGPQGEYTDLVVARMDEIEAFWNIHEPTLPTNQGPVKLLGVHGSDIESDDNRLAVCAAYDSVGLLDTSAIEDCNSWSAAVDQLIRNAFPQDSYSHPYLSLNFFTVFPAALPPIFDPLLGEEPVMIMVGDGMLEFMEISSVDTDLGVDFVLGHEFCHVIQADLGVLDPMTYGTNLTLDQKERIELMCDSMSAYYLAHADGDDLTVDQVDQVALHAMTLGDGDEDDDTGLFFHGTPGQRECAALFGAQLAKSVNGSVIPLADWIAQFDDAYVDIYQGNPNVCPGLSRDVECSPDTPTPPLGTPSPTATPISTSPSNSVVPAPTNPSSSPPPSSAGSLQPAPNDDSSSLLSSSTSPGSTMIVVLPVVAWLLLIVL